jgi:uncharacterized protein (DUF2147 family)
LSAKWFILPGDIHEGLAPRMKRMLLPLTAAVLVGVTTLARAQDPTGLWRTKAGTYQYRIEPCGKALCVFLAWVADNVRDVNNPDPAKRDRRVIGTIVVADGAPDGPNRWKGHGYWFRNGNTYAGTAELIDSNTLKASGCILGGLICGSTNLYRVN